jgi:hypothetical protein
MKTYFGYNATTLRGVQRNSYTSSTWMQLMKTELDASRPILYAGFGNGGGHAFVCDGYNSSDYFHMNWGWGGSYDGYFLLTALNPTGLGIGGGSGGYNSNQQALIGIQPPSGGGGGGGGTTLDIRLYASVTVSPSPIPFQAAFTVNTNIANYSTTTGFTGDICAALFDANNTFVGYIETKTNRSLSANSYYSAGLSFSTTGMSAQPGNYTVGIFVKPTGASTWTTVSNGNYSNFVPVTIQGTSNDLDLYSAISCNPTSPIQNQSATVTFNLINRRNTAFNGIITVDLHDADGTWMEEIGRRSNTSLCANCYFATPLSITTNSITADPGTYKIGIWYQATGSSTWQLVGSGSFSNPKEIIVRSPGLSPDIYENNNTAASAYPFVLSFSGNSANRNSSGSNIHIGSDHDYYSINLPAGYQYQINARVHDSYNSGNGQTYTNDVLFSYSLDGGVSFSDTYDDVMPSALVVNGGRTVIFKVASYFTGTTGTYLLDIPVTRTLSSAVEELPQAVVQLFPNPAKEVLNLRWEQAPSAVVQWQILNALGQQVLQGEAWPQGDLLLLPLSDLPQTGLYWLQWRVGEEVMQVLPFQRN